MTAQILTEPTSPDGGLVYYLGSTDAPACQCGNDTSFDGFVYLEDDLRATDIRASSGDKLSRLMCAQCGRVYRNDVDVEPTVLEESTEGYVRYDGLGDYLATLPDDERQARIERFEEYANA